MNELKANFARAAKTLTSEIDREDRKLFNGRLKDADLTEYKDVRGTTSKTTTTSQEVLLVQDKIL